MTMITWDFIASTPDSHTLMAQADFESRSLSCMSHSEPKLSYLYANLSSGSPFLERCTMYVCFCACHDRVLDRHGGVSRGLGGRARRL